jgi:uncharacterized protein YcfJ
MNSKILSCLLVAASLIAGCANNQGGGLTTTEKSALGAGALGAGLGAIIGSQSGNAGAGVAIGTAAGLLGGGLVGSQVEQQERSTMSQEERLRRQEEEIARQRRELEELRRQGGSDTYNRGGSSSGYQGYNNRNSGSNDQYY